MTYLYSRLSVSLKGTLCIIILFKHIEHKLFNFASSIKQHREKGPRVNGSPVEPILCNI